MTDGGYEAAKPFFEQARTLLDGELKGSKEYSTKYDGLKKKNFPDLLMDSEGDIGILHVATENSMLLMGEKVVRIIRGFRLGFVFSRKDERVPGELRKLPHESVYCSPVLMNVEGRSLYSLEDKIEKLRKRLRGYRDKRERCAISFFDKIPVGRDVLGDFRFDFTSTPVHSVNGEDARIGAFFESPLPQSVVNTAIQAIRTELARGSGVKFVGSVRGGETRKKR